MTLTVNRPDVRRFICINSSRCFAGLISKLYMRVLQNYSYPFLCSILSLTHFSHCWGYLSPLITSSLIAGVVFSLFTPFSLIVGVISPLFTPSLSLLGLYLPYSPLLSHFWGYFSLIHSVSLISGVISPLFTPSLSVQTISNLLWLSLTLEILPFFPNIRVIFRPFPHY